MNIKIVFDKVANFTLKRLSELIGLLLLALSILLLISLITYSPEDPNFIFPNNSEIKNIKVRMTDSGDRNTMKIDITFNITKDPNSLESVQVEIA